MTESPSTPSRGLRLADLVSVVLGYGLASLLARSVWPRFPEQTGAPAVAFALEFAWLGLAMSGPVLLIWGRRRLGGPAPRPRPATRPPRPGRLIGDVPAVDRLAGARRPVAVEPTPPTGPDSKAPRVEWTRAELAWMAIGSYWITLTLFVAHARVGEATGALAGLIPIIATFGLFVLLPTGLRRPGAATPPRGWTHAVGLGLLWTWPVAWVLLFLLARTL